MQNLSSQSLKYLPRSPEAVRQIRLHLDLTLAELGRLLSRSPLSILNYERNVTPMPAITWAALQKLLKSDSATLLKTAYKNVPGGIPRRRRGCRVTDARMRHKEAPARAPGTSTELGPRLRALRESAHLSKEAVATAAFGANQKARLHRLENNQKCSLPDAISVHQAIETALATRRAIKLTKLKKSAENLRMLRKVFDATQREFALKMLPEPHARGMISMYECGSLREIPALRWTALITDLAAFERKIKRSVDAALAEIAIEIAAS